MDLKSVANSEAGLTPKNIGEKTFALFLDQIDDMIAYTRHSSQKSAEGLGDSVEAVSDLNQSRQGSKAGNRDNGWKAQKRNALDNIKNSEDLNAALSYLLEEQHTILETCHGEIESVLINTHVDEYWLPRWLQTLWR